MTELSKLSRAAIAQIPDKELLEALLNDCHEMVDDYIHEGEETPSQAMAMIELFQAAMAAVKAEKAVPGTLLVEPREPLLSAVMGFVRVFAAGSLDDLDDR